MNDPPRFLVLKDDRHGDKGDVHDRDDDHVHDLHGDDGDVPYGTRMAHHDGGDDYMNVPCEITMVTRIRCLLCEVCRRHRSVSVLLLLMQSL